MNTTYYLLDGVDPTSTIFLRLAIRSTAPSGFTAIARALKRTGPDYKWNRHHQHLSQSYKILKTHESKEEVLLEYPEIFL